MQTLPSAPYRNLQAAHGSHVPFFFAIKDANWNPNASAAADWHAGGMKRSMSSSASLDQIDVTTDTDFRGGDYKDYISGFKEGSISIDFIAKRQTVGGELTEEAQGLKTLWTHLINPKDTAATGGMPIIWIKYFHPIFDKEINTCLVLTSIGEEFPYDDAISFSAEFAYKGAPLIKDVPAAKTV